MSCFVYIFIVDRTVFRCITHSIVAADWTTFLGMSFVFSLFFVLSACWYQKIINLKGFYVCIFRSFDTHFIQTEHCDSSLVLTDADNGNRLKRDTVGDEQRPFDRVCEREDDTCVTVTLSLLIFAGRRNNRLNVVSLSKQVDIRLIDWSFDRLVSTLIMRTTFTSSCTFQLGTCHFGTFIFIVFFVDVYLH